MLETPKGEEQLRDFVRLRLFSDDDVRGQSYKDWLWRLFGANSPPMYVVINEYGEVTAYEADISVFYAGPTQDNSKAPEIFQRFIDTAKGRGDPFTFDGGFLPPQNNAAKGK